jgi:polyphenol oxidase
MAASGSATDLELIVPDWPAPAGVRAAMSTRRGGVSQGPYASLNLGHGGDDPGCVAENRRRLRQALGLEREPGWLRQVHGTRVAELGAPAPPDGVEADASFTTTAGMACAVMVADCLPVLFCDERATVVAAAHAGWRGLAAGVLEATVRALPAAPGSLMAWLGPAIGPGAFEVGPEVRAAFVAADPGAAGCFVVHGAGGGKFLADLFALARRRLAACGVTRVSGGGQCTHSQPGRFFSFRRDGRCGRMAALVWRSGDGERQSGKQ